MKKAIKNKLIFRKAYQVIQTSNNNLLIKIDSQNAIVLHRNYVKAILASKPKKKAA